MANSELNFFHQEEQNFTLLFTDDHTKGAQEVESIYISFLFKL